MEWQAVDFTVLGQWSIGYIYVEDMPMGEYALGVFETSTSTDESGLENSKDIIEVFPNPSSGRFNFNINSEHASQLEIYSYEGKLVETIDIRTTKEILYWNAEGFPGGNYIAVLRGKNNESLGSTRIIYMK